MNLYDILEINKDADLETIKTAFKEKAKQYHPDKGGDPNQFIKIQRAYEILCDPKKRKFYDETGYDKEDREFQIIVKTIQKYFIHFLQRGESIYIEDICLFHCKGITVLKDDVQKVENDKMALLRLKENLVQVRGSVDFMGDTLDNMLNAANQSIRAHKENLKLANKITDILKWYKSKNPKETESFRKHGATTTAFTTWARY